MECQIILFILILIISIKAEMLRPTLTINPSPSISAENVRATNQPGPPYKVTMLRQKNHSSPSIHAEMLRPTNNPTPTMKVEMLRTPNNPRISGIPYDEAKIFITPRPRFMPVLEPNDTQDVLIQINDDYRRKHYSTHMPNIHVPVSPNEMEIKKIFFKTVRTENGNQVLEPVQVFLKSTQQPHNQNTLYTTLNTGKTIGPTKLLDPGATKRDTGMERERQDTQKYQLIPYEFDTQGGILREGPAILNSAFEIIIPPQKESVHQNEKKYYHVDNYFDFERIAKEREKTRLKAEIIAKSPPFLVQEDINISRRIPVDKIKTVNVPIPSPYLVPVPQRYPVPQPYVVPIEIIRPFAVPIVKTEKIEVERPVPVEIEKHVKVPIEKKVFVRVAQPYPVDKLVPVEVKREVPYEVPVYPLARYSIVKYIHNRK